MCLVKFRGKKAPYSFCNQNSPLLIFNKGGCRVWKFHSVFHGGLGPPSTPFLAVAKLFYLPLNSSFHIPKPFCIKLV